MNTTRTEIIPKETKKKEYKNENRNDTNNEFDPNFPKILRFLCETY